MKVKMTRNGRYRLVPAKWVDHFSKRGWSVVDPIQEAPEESDTTHEE
jgi:hypothetical protein